MKAIFMSRRKEDLLDVYAPELMARIAEKTGSEVAVYDKNDVFAAPRAFLDTQYIFSTWGMPEFTEAEIRRFFPKLECVFYAAGTVQKFARPFLRCGV